MELLNELKKHEITLQKDKYYKAKVNEETYLETIMFLYKNNIRYICDKERNYEEYQMINENYKYSIKELYIYNNALYHMATEDNSRDYIEINIEDIERIYKIKEE